MDQKEMLLGMFEKLEKCLHKNISVAVSEVAKEVNGNMKKILKSVFDQIQSLEGSMWKDILEAKLLLDQIPNEEMPINNGRDLRSQNGTNTVQEVEEIATKDEFFSYPDDGFGDFPNDPFLPDQNNDPYEFEPVADNLADFIPEEKSAKKKRPVEKKGKYKKGYACDVCDYSTDFLSELKNHIDEKHEGQSTLNDFIESKEAENEKLNVKKMIEANERKIKKATKEELKKFVCKICCHRAKDNDAFDEHKAMHEKVEQVIQRTDDPASKLEYLQCKECDYKTPNGRVQRANFISHVKHKHLNMRKFTCEQCGYSAVVKNDLTRHIRHVHDKEYDYFCEVSTCSFGTTKRSLVDNHMRRHHKDFVKKGTTEAEIETA